MSHEHCNKRQTSMAGRRMVGLSLIELMIAMVLGLVVLGAAFVVFMSNQRTFGANEGINRIQESARVAFELMSRDIRAAGGSACSNVSEVMTNNVDSISFSETPVTGTANTLTVVSGDDTAYRIVGSTPTSVTFDSSQVPNATEIFRVNDPLLLCNANRTYVVRASGVNSNSVTFPALPGNYDLSSDLHASPATVVIARFRNVTWSVNENERGGRSLFVTRQGAGAEEVAEGVTDLGFEYLQAGGTSYTLPTAPGFDWARVVAVRVSMTLGGPDIDGQNMVRTSSNVVSMRSRSL